MLFCFFCLDGNEESSSKSEDSWDEENLEEMEVLSTLNSFRNKTNDQCVDIFNFIRHENLVNFLQTLFYKHLEGVPLLIWFLQVFFSKVKDGKKQFLLKLQFKMYYLHICNR